MNIFETIPAYDYIIAVLGVLGVILGIAQLGAKRCIGIMKIDQYTGESAGRFAVISSVIYILGGILTAAAPFAVSYINSQNFGVSLPTQLPSWILIAVVAVALIAQTSTLKKKF